jgi:hypothetical protein
MHQPLQPTDQRPAWLPTDQELSTPLTPTATHCIADEDEEMAAWIAEANAAAAELAEELAARW